MISAAMRHRSMLPLRSSELMSRRSLDRSECRDRSKATVQFQVLECWWRPSKVHHQLPNAGAAERGQAASWRDSFLRDGPGAWVSQLMMTGWIRRNYKSARGIFQKDGKISELRHACVHESLRLDRPQSPAIWLIRKPLTLWGELRVTSKLYYIDYIRTFTAEIYVFPYSYRFLMCPLSKFNGVILAQLLHNY
jgi:hypothetical protein